jgi:hypothetical protein
VAGWLYNPHRPTKRALVVLADQTDEIVGVGLLGEKRFDVEQVLGRSAAFSGFVAYLAVKADRQPFAIISPETGCELPLMTARFKPIAISNSPPPASPARRGS